MTGQSKALPACAVAVVIPSFRVRKHILDVIAGIGEPCSRIFVVDDRCPEGTGDYVEQNCKDPRVRVVRNPENLGVGGAVMAGYRTAIAEGAAIIVKIDGDGQMPPELLPNFVAPILSGEADYTKGNRFYDLGSLAQMPAMRLFGNAVLSFLTKLSAGYWDIFDPTNGYTAVHADVVRHLPLDKISRRYFFETDMLFRLNTIRAVVVDVPMEARYGDEVSNLSIVKILPEFILKHVRNFLKRIFYNYFLRDLSVASIELVAGLAMTAFGCMFGVVQWSRAVEAGTQTPVGTVMLAAVPVILGTQFLLAFIGHDILATPRRPIHPRLTSEVRQIADGKRRESKSGDG